MMISKQSDHSYGTEHFVSIEECKDPSYIIKKRFIIKLTVGIIVVLTIGGGITYYSQGLDIRTIKRADIVEFSAAAVEDYKIRGISSECFYSTKTDREAKDNVKTFTNYHAFNVWYESHHDITRINPSGLEECTASTFFNKGYYAIVLSPSELYNPAKTVLATAKYQSDAGDLIIALGQKNRDPSYQYDKDLNSECLQIYTIVYLNPHEVKDAGKITFAIEKAK